MTEYLPDHPDIASAMRTGYPKGVEPKEPICPRCRKPCDTIYKDLTEEIVGCDLCVSSHDPWETPECFD